jgi:hypothetical protein
MEIIKNNTSSHIRMLATHNVADQQFLQELALHDLDHHVRLEATKKLEDQSVLAEIAKNNESSSVREEAVKNLTDQASLADIARNDVERTIRKTAYDKLIDRNLAKRILLENCFHEFTYGGTYHPDNTGRAMRTATCKLCGYTEEQNYGWDDNW